MKHLLTLDRDELRRWLVEHEQAEFRARQIERWVYQGRVVSFDDMSDLPATLRAALKDEFRIWTTQVAAVHKAPDGTRKLVLQLADGGRIECVLLRDRDNARRTVCISTQVGCAMGCVFCASGLDGVQRNLTRGEILEQMLLLARLLPADERISHIVVMGMGEPLANLNELLPALERASHSQGLGVGVRRITISTVGLPAAIRRLAKLDARFHLAVSLHAPNDELRNRLVPINRKTGLEAVLSAADHYFEVSSRRLTFEYVLLADVNDQPEHARQLAALLRGRAALLNVIPYNPVAGLPYRTPSPAAQGRFREILEQSGVNVQFRERKGSDISAACGQLRRQMSESGPAGAAPGGSGPADTDPRSAGPDAVSQSS
jgi:23S rRNA (adenine2503-C2)-methyltransferase